MAKLSANGQRELYRMEKEIALTATVNYDGGAVCRQTVAVMDSRVILRKEDYYRNGKRDHGTGWRKVGRLKDGSEQAYRARLEAQGYEVAR